MSWLTWNRRRTSSTRPAHKAKPSSRRRPRAVPQLEELEGRLTPATLVNPTTVTFQDVDGDDVTVKISQPAFTDLATANNVLKFSPGSVDGSNGLRQQLTDVFLLNLLSATNGIGLSITAKRNVSHGGDSHVNVGQVDAVGLFKTLDLGAVVVDGDLGRIQAGDANTATTALKSLTVDSLGHFGTTTGSPDLQSDINGRLGSLHVTSDVVGAFVNVTGKIGSVFVGGSLQAVGNADNSGLIVSGGDMGAVLIQGDIIGGGGQDSGEVLCGHTITGGLLNGVLVGVQVGGSIIGGGGFRSGRISADRGMPAVKVGGDIRGGSEDLAGEISTQVGAIASLRVGGSLVGSSGSSSGAVVCDQALGPVRIGGDLVGGDGPKSGSISNIAAHTDIASVTVGGSLRSGAGDLSASIRSDGTLGPVKVKGSLIGTSAHPVIISGFGEKTPTAPTDVALRSVFVRGHVEFAQILAGYFSDGTPFIADAQIGSVTVGGDWIASSVAAGVVDGGNGFGNSGDAKITDPGEDPLIIAKIGSITIGGQVIGTSAGGDHFGFVAEKIGSFTVGGEALLLTAAPDMITLGVFGDVTLLEV